MRWSQEFTHQYPHLTKLSLPFCGFSIQSPSQYSSWRRNTVAKDRYTGRISRPIRVASLYYGNVVVVGCTVTLGLNIVAITSLTCFQSRLRPIIVILRCHCHLDDCPITCLRQLLTARWLFVRRGGGGIGGNCCACGSQKKCWSSLQILEHLQCTQFMNYILLTI